MTATSLPDATLAGFRLVRKLAVGSRADVYLGVGSAGVVALKVFAPGTSTESVGSELDALGRLDSPHLVRLLDVSNPAGEHPVLVLERVARGSVAALLGERSELECGEAVTLLAPLAALVAELHDVGVAHRRIGATSIHLDAAGKPVLLGLGHCALFVAESSMAVIDAEPAAAQDRDSLAALALGVLARVRTVAGERRTSELTRWIESAPRVYEFPKQLEERLFALAEPTPIAMSTERSAASVIPSRIAPAAAVATPTAAPQDSAAGSASWLTRLLSAALVEDPMGQVRQRALTVLRGVRPRFWLLAGGIALALMLAVALLPAGAASSPRGAAPDPGPTSPAPSTTVPSAPPLPDDPLRAAEILLAARRSCIRSLSILCLADVDEASSAAFASDAALIQQVQGGEEIPRSALESGDALTLVERLGDSALIGLGSSATSVPASTPGSILVIRTRAGWRIRDYLSGGRATASPSASGPV